MRELPDYQTLMLPVLKSLADGKERHIREITDLMAHEFQMTEEELSKLQPSGGVTVFADRVHWAVSYLKQAALLERSRRGFYKSTQAGQALLAKDLSRIDVKLLMTIDAFAKAHYKGQPSKADPVEPASTEEATLLQTQTPEDLIENAFSEYQKTLADEVLERIRNVTPVFFERLVVELLVKMGYGGSIKDAGKAIGRTGDEGIDGIIKEDKLGLDVIYIQAKRWKAGNVIGRPEVQKFVGALAGQGAKKGVFITTSSFTREAMDYKPMNETKLVLIDGLTLANLMIEHHLGVSTLQIYELKKVDNDYFEEGE